MNMSNNSCENLANTLKGKSKVENGVCTVIIERNDIQATIGGVPFKSLFHSFNFQPIDESGNALITGEMVLLENEVYRFTTEIVNTGIIVSAIHNHWIFDNPKLIYIHIECIMNSEDFAKELSYIIYK